MALWLCPLGLVAQAQSAEGAIDSQTFKQATVTVIPIIGEINRAQVVLIRRGIEEARENGSEYIIFEIDTFGGRVDSALQITTLIGAQQDAITIAYITISAEGTGVSWSAGALISFACDMIFMAPGTSIGAATPVIQQTDGSVQTGSEKTVSAIRTQMAALAEKNGYSRAIALAMVDPDTEIFEVLEGDELVGVYTEEEFTRLKQQETLSLSKGAIVSPQGKLLSLTAGEMERYQVSSGSPVDYDALYTVLKISAIEPTEIANSWLDTLVAFLTSGAVVSLLIVIGLIGLYLEFTSPGFGLPGVVGVIALGLMFGANFMLGRVESLELLLILVGFVLLVIELFLIPGFGVAGVTGILAIVVAMVLSFQTFTIPQFDWQWDIFHRNILIVLGSIVGGLILALSTTPLARRTFLFRKIALFDTQDSKLGFVVQGAAERERYLGQQGESTTTLRPAGKAQFGNKVLTVETSGEYIEKGEKVTVMRVDSNRIVVSRDTLKGEDKA